MEVTPTEYGTITCSIEHSDSSSHTEGIVVSTYDDLSGDNASSQSDDQMGQQVLGYLEVQPSDAENATIILQPQGIEIDGQRLILTHGEEGNEIIVVVSSEQDSISEQTVAHFSQSPTGHHIESNLVNQALLVADDSSGAQLEIIEAQECEISQNHGDLHEPVYTEHSDRLSDLRTGVPSSLGDSVEIRSSVWTIKEKDAPEKEDNDEIIFIPMPSSHVQDQAPEQDDTDVVFIPMPSSQTQSVSLFSTSPAEEKTPNLMQLACIAQEMHSADQKSNQRPIEPVNYSESFDSSTDNETYVSVIQDSTDLSGGSESIICTTEYDENCMRTIASTEEVTSNVSEVETSSSTVESSHDSPVPSVDISANLSSKPLDNAVSVIHVTSSEFSRTNEFENIEAASENSFENKSVELFEEVDSGILDDHHSNEFISEREEVLIIDSENDIGEEKTQTNDSDVEELTNINYLTKNKFEEEHHLLNKETDHNIQNEVAEVNILLHEKSDNNLENISMAQNFERNEVNNFCSESVNIENIICDQKVDNIKEKKESTTTLRDTRSYKAEIIPIPKKRKISAILYDLEDIQTSNIKEPQMAPNIDVVDLSINTSIAHKDIDSDGHCANFSNQIDNEPVLPTQTRSRKMSLRHNASTSVITSLTPEVIQVAQEESKPAMYEDTNIQIDIHNEMKNNNSSSLDLSKQSAEIVIEDNSSIDTTTSRENVRNSTPKSVITSRSTRARQIKKKDSRHEIKDNSDLQLDDVEEINVINTGGSESDSLKISKQCDEDTLNDDSHMDIRSRRTASKKSVITSRKSRAKQLKKDSEIESVTDDQLISKHEIDNKNDEISVSLEMDQQSYSIIEDDHGDIESIRNTSKKGNNSRTRKKKDSNYDEENENSEISENSSLQIRKESVEAIPSLNIRSKRNSRSVITTQATTTSQIKANYSNPETMDVTKLNSNDDMDNENIEIIEDASVKIDTQSAESTNTENSYLSNRSRRSTSRNVIATQTTRKCKINKKDLKAAETDDVAGIQSDSTHEVGNETSEISGDTSLEIGKQTVEATDDIPLNYRSRRSTSKSVITSRKNKSGQIKKMDQEIEIKEPTEAVPNSNYETGNKNQLIAETAVLDITEQTVIDDNLEDIGSRTSKNSITSRTTRSTKMNKRGSKLKMDDVAYIESDFNYIKDNDILEDAPSDISNQTIINEDMAKSKSESSENTTSQISTDQMKEMEVDSVADVQSDSKMDNEDKKVLESVPSEISTLIDEDTIVDVIPINTRSKRSYSKGSRATRASQMKKNDSNAEMKVDSSQYDFDFKDDDENVKISENAVSQRDNSFIEDKNLKSSRENSKSVITSRRTRSGKDSKNKMVYDADVQSGSNYEADNEILEEPSLDEQKVEDTIVESKDYNKSRRNLSKSILSSRRKKAQQGKNDSLTEMDIESNVQSDFNYELEKQDNELSENSPKIGKESGEVDVNEDIPVVSRSRRSAKSVITSQKIRVGQRKNSIPEMDNNADVLSDSNSERVTDNNENPQNALEISKQSVKETVIQDTPIVSRSKRRTSKSVITSQTVAKQIKDNSSNSEISDETEVHLDSSHKSEDKSKEISGNNSSEIMEHIEDISIDTRSRKNTSKSITASRKSRAGGKGNNSKTEMYGDIDVQSDSMCELVKSDHEISENALENDKQSFEGVAIEDTPIISRSRRSTYKSVITSRTTAEQIKKSHSKSEMSSETEIHLDSSHTEDKNKEIPQNNLPEISEHITEDSSLENIPVDTTTRKSTSKSAVTLRKTRAGQRKKSTLKPEMENDPDVQSDSHCEQNTKNQVLESASQEIINQSDEATTVEDRSVDTRSRRSSSKSVITSRMTRAAQTKDNYSKSELTDNAAESDSSLKFDNKDKEVSKDISLEIGTENEASVVTKLPKNTSETIITPRPRGRPRKRPVDEDIPVQSDSGVLINNTNEESEGGVTCENVRPNKRSRKSQIKKNDLTVETSSNIDETSNSNNVINDTNYKISEASLLLETNEQSVEASVIRKDPFETAYFSDDNIRNSTIDNNNVKDKDHETLSTEPLKEIDLNALSPEKESHPIVSDKIPHKTVEGIDESEPNPELISDIQCQKTYARKNIANKDDACLTINELSSDVKTIEHIQGLTNDLHSHSEIEIVEENLVKTPMKTYARKSKLQNNQFTEQTSSAMDLEKIELFSCEELVSDVFESYDNDHATTSNSQSVNKDDALKTAEIDDTNLLSDVKSKVSATYKIKKKLVPTTPENGVKNLRARSSTESSDVPNVSSKQDNQSENESSQAHDNEPTSDRKKASRKRHSSIDSHEESAQSSKKTNSSDSQSPEKNGISWEKLIKSSPTKSKKISRKKLKEKVQKQFMSLYESSYSKSKRRGRPKKSTTGTSKTTTPTKKKISDAEIFVYRAKKYNFVRERVQNTSLTSSPATPYCCNNCKFSCLRIENIIAHYKVCSKPDMINYAIDDNRRQRIRGEDVDCVSELEDDDTSHSNEMSNGISGSLLGENNEAESSKQSGVFSDSEADEDTPSISEVQASKKLRFYENDVVWVNVRNTFWPALVCRLYFKEKKASVMLIDSPTDRQGLKVKVKRILTFNDAEVNKKILDDGRNYSDPESFLKATQKAENYFRKRKILKYDVSPKNFFGIDSVDIASFQSLSDSSSSSESDIQDEEEEEEDDSQQFSSKHSRELDDDLSDVADSPLYSTTPHHRCLSEEEELDNSKLLSCLLEGTVDEYLVGIYNEEIKCDRHAKFFSADPDERSELKQGSCFGRIDSERHEQIFTYFHNMFRSCCTYEDSSIVVPYIYEVWIPEAVIKAISLVQDISVEDAEIIFDNESSNEHTSIEEN